MNKIYSSILISFIVFLVSCDKKEEPVKEETKECTPVVVVVNDNINSPTVWEDCHIYLISTTSISINSTLTIQPGAIIKFKDLVYDNSILVSGNGQINAVGTVDKPIIFTSEKDDAHGGDNNGDGNISSPARGDWGGIVLNSSTSVFKYCTFLYGGEGPNAGAGQPTLEFQFYYGIIDHCVFAHCGGEKTYNGYGVVDARYCNDQKFSITNSVFFGNIKPLFLNPFLSIDNSNVFHNPANPAEINTMNGIFFTSEGNEATTDVTWTETEVPMVLTGSLAIDQGKRLILAPGVIIKVADLPAIGYNKISMHHNSSSIDNHDAAGVYFTSYFDDAHGGDTNGDGSASSPSKGDWYGVQDFTATLGTNNQCYGWSNILYASYP